jgi:hypothetical protein
VGPRAGLDTEATGKILCLRRGSNGKRPVLTSPTLAAVRYGRELLAPPGVAHISYRLLHATTRTYYYAVSPCTVLFVSVDPKRGLPEAPVAVDVTLNTICLPYQTFSLGERRP